MDMERVVVMASMRVCGRERRGMPAVRKVGLVDLRSLTGWKAPQRYDRTL
jgi:hypothetical protein